MDGCNLKKINCNTVIPLSTNSKHGNFIMCEKNVNCQAHAAMVPWVIARCNQISCYRHFGEPAAVSSYKVYKLWQQIPLKCWKYL